MVQTRTGTNFDIDAITRLVNADTNVPAMSDQSITDPMAEALEAEAEDFETELQNPSSNRVDEAQRFMERPGAAKLSAGRLSAIQSGITVAEKRDEFSFGSQRSDRILEEREKSEEKERKSKADIAKFADDAADASQLSTTPDRYGNSQQDYADLNNELKTKDGQDRFMSFLRMMYPHMTDAQIKERMLDVQAVAAVEDGTATAEQRQRVASKTPEEIAGLKGDVDQYLDATKGHGLDPQIADRGDAPRVEGAANNDTAGVAALNQTDLLAGNTGSAALSATGGATSPSRTSLTTELEGRSEFAAAPSLRANFVAANGAKERPLDQPSPQVIASATPAAPLPAASAGLDV